ncbi:sulfatase-like hydrolase/transferase [Zhouia amylolytica]|uniref:N-acetylgalactosamine-6-sulfate sulfatase n=1 Tax=Zhouia amylolytica AD3 TaxID=1286632 RepID=W2URW1_9FLAO|nr:sulfatase-like hydrolase/transferase [Zhouia amylolytica]ETN96694.1 N-acetylgalactosamine-6-sulfate sulfatase [Zhouia amylolytica AD3]
MRLPRLFMICILLMGIFPTVAQGQTKDQQPNIILIVADDLGFGDLSINGSKQIKTPYIDALAKNGIRFTEGYVSAPVCSPSRAGLLTGVNQVEFGHDNNLGGNQPGFDPEYNGMPVSQTTIADRLKSLGYATGIIGKWHLGKLPQFHPLKRGFDEFWGYTGGGHDYFEALPNGKGYKEPLESNFKTPQAITYLTDDKGDECIDFIKRHRDEPFFLYAAFNAPHTPMQATKSDLTLYKHIADKKRRTYAAMVHRLDVNVGRIMETLKKEKLDKQTLVVFISDNGGPVTTNASNNAPYRGQKGILLEGGIHVPFIMSYPDLLEKNQTYKNPVSALDLAPTFVALAGGSQTIEADTFSGENLIPFLQGSKNATPEREFKWRFTISAAIREGDWKLIRLPDRLPQLYHLPTDVTEENDLALERLDITKALLKKLGDWDVQLPHPVFLEGPMWRKRQVSLYDYDYIMKQPE